MTEEGRGTAGKASLIFIKLTLTSPLSLNWTTEEHGRAWFEEESQERGGCVAALMASGPGCLGVTMFSVL